MIAGPEVAWILCEFEENFNLHHHKADLRHHEQMPATQKAFAKEVKALVSTINDMGNPYMEPSQDLLVLDSKEIMSDSVVHTVKNIEIIRKEKYRIFIKERLPTSVQSMDDMKPIKDAISKNKLELFSQPSTPEKSKAKQESVIWKQSCVTISSLYIASMVRESNPEDFFLYENNFSQIPDAACLKVYKGHTKVKIKLG